MNIVWECEYDQEQCLTIENLGRKKFENILYNLKIDCLDVIYVTGSDYSVFSQRCKEIFELYYHVCKNIAQISQNTMAECLEILDSGYRQILVIRSNIFILFFMCLYNDNAVDDEKSKLMSQQLVYHELAHLAEMKVRYEKGLMRNWLINNQYENSKILWSEYFAEKNSIEKFTQNQLSILKLEGKFDEYKNFRGEISFSDFLYHLVHFLALKSESKEVELYDCFRECNYSFLIDLIINLNDLLKSIYLKFPYISKKDIVDIEEVFNKMICETKKVFY